MTFGFLFRVAFVEEVVSWQITFLTSLFLEYILEKKQHFRTTSSSTSKVRSTKIPRPSALTSPELEISHITASPKTKTPPKYTPVDLYVCQLAKRNWGQPGTTLHSVQNAEFWAEALCSIGALQVHPSHNPPGVPLHPCTLFKFGHYWPTVSP